MSFEQDKKLRAMENALNEYIEKYGMSQLARAAMDALAKNETAGENCTCVIKK